jgi:hypothetical protein
VIVEGDDRLLSYAVTKAANDPQSPIEIKVGSASAGREHQDSLPPIQAPIDKLVIIL